MEPEVTVLIPSYNAGSYLLDALNSVFLQTYQGWEIIIIDDASTDDSLSKVSHYIDHIKVRLIRNEQNLGHSKAMNAGLSLVTTPYVIQLDADDWFYPYTLAVMLAEAKLQPLHVGLISGNINVVHEDEHGHTISSYIIKNRSFQEKYDYLLCNCSQWPRFYRTSALKSIGGWPTDDPYEGRYMEDKRVLTRLIEEFHFHWIDVVLYNYRRHANNQTHLLEIYQEMTKWNARDALKRWGDMYEPVFEIENGWTEILAFQPKP